MNRTPWKPVPNPDPAAFARFAAQWRRVGMPGEVRDDGSAGASVEPPAWGVRLYYVPTVGAEVLATLPTAETADDKGQGRVLRALDDAALPHAGLVLTLPTVCPACLGPLIVDDGPRFRGRLLVDEDHGFECAACRKRLLRAGRHWEPAPETDHDRRVEEIAAQYEALFSDMTEEPVDVDRAMLRYGMDVVVLAEFVTREAADLIALASKRLPGLTLRKQRGRWLSLVPTALYKPPR
jgi:hypothetical protein